MLEHRCLHIARWTSTEAGWTRFITDAAGNCLGFVQYEGSTKTSWFSWLRGTRLTVLETDDASLLMTLVRSWGMTRVWDVYDADERHVGSIVPPSLVDADGERRGYLGDDRIVDASRQMLATFRKLTPIVEVGFATDQPGNPFLRMLVLAAILVQDAVPIC